MDQDGEITLRVSGERKVDTWRRCVIFARRSLDGDCFRIASLARGSDSMREAVLLLQMMYLAYVTDYAPNISRPQSHVIEAC